MNLNLHRSFDTETFSRVAKEIHKDYEVSGFDAEEMVSLLNILLRENDDFALFEYYDSGIYWGHYFFSEAKGKDALDLADRMLKSLRIFDPDAKSVYGCIPIENKKTIWLTRQLGFKPVSTTETTLGVMKIYKKDLIDE